MQLKQKIDKNIYKLKNVLLKLITAFVGAFIGDKHRQESLSKCQLTIIRQNISFALKKANFCSYNECL